MNGNEHARHAAALIENDACKGNYATMAQIEATLAVAHELRTANLIQYAVHNSDALAEGVDVTIRERLGMAVTPTAPAKDFSTPGAWVDPRCSKPLMDGRNEIRCWLPANHGGECK